MQSAVIWECGNVQWTCCLQKGRDIISQRRTVRQMVIGRPSSFLQWDLGMRCFLQWDLGMRCFLQWDLGMGCFLQWDLGMRCFLQWDLGMRCFLQWDLGMRCFLQWDLGMRWSWLQGCHHFLSLLFIVSMHFVFGFLLLHLCVNAAICWQHDLACRVIPNPTSRVASTVGCPESITDQFRRYAISVSVWSGSWFRFKVVIISLWQSMHAKFYSQISHYHKAKGWNLRERKVSPYTSYGPENMPTVSGLCFKCHYLLNNILNTQNRPTEFFCSIKTLGKGSIQYSCCFIYLFSTNPSLVMHVFVVYVYVRACLYMCACVCVTYKQLCVHTCSCDDLFANVINAYICRPLKHFGLLRDGATLIMYHYYYSVLTSVLCWRTFSSFVGLLIHCLFVDALYEWNINKTNSWVHFNVSGK